MTTVFLDAVFKPFFKIVHDTGQQLTIDRTNFLTDGCLQIIQSMGFVSVNTRFKIPPKKKITRWNIGRARGPRHVSETGNEVTGKHVSNTGHWLVCSVRCGTIMLKPHIGTVYSCSAHFWVLPIQKMSGSHGSPCITSIGLLDNLHFLCQSRNSLLFVKPATSLPYKSKPLVVHPEPDYSTARSNILIFKHILILILPKRLSFPHGPRPSVFPTKNLHEILVFLPLSFLSILFSKTLSLFSLPPPICPRILHLHK